MTRILLTVKEAAEATGCSVDTIRRAIRSTDYETFPPPLKAKKGPKGKYLLLPVDLQSWAESLKDA